jgi:hypothetical protein
MNWSNAGKAAVERLEKVTQRSNSMCGFQLKRGSLQGPKLTHGRTSDRSSPFKEEPLPAGSLYIADLGYLDWGSIAARRAAGSYTLTRAQARTLYWTVEGKPLQLDPLLPHQVGQTKERMSFGSPMSTAI